MSFWEVVLLVVIAVVAGGLAQVFSGFSIIGFIFSVLTGLAGALLGEWAAGVLGLSQVIAVGEMEFVIWPILGAIVFTAIYGMLTPRRAD